MARSNGRTTERDRRPGLQRLRTRGASVRLQRSGVIDSVAVIHQSNFVIRKLVSNMSSLIGKSVTAITVTLTVGLGLLAAYLALTAIPTFLGMAGVYFPEPASPTPIADSMARLVLAFVCLVGIIVVDRLQNWVVGE